MKARELSILRAMESVLHHPEQKTWLFPMYPKCYRRFSRKRSSKWCIGDHYLFIVEYEDDEGEAQSIFGRGIPEEIERYLTLTPSHYASMQIHQVVVGSSSESSSESSGVCPETSPDEVSIDMQTYGASFDCDRVYPCFRYYDSLGLWISYDEDEYGGPVVLSFYKYSKIQNITLFDILLKLCFSKRKL